MFSSKVVEFSISCKLATVKAYFILCIGTIKSYFFQDGTFSLADFTDAYQENEVQRVIRAYENSISIDVHCSVAGGDWAKLPDMPFVKHCKIRVNPTDKLDTGSQAIKGFIGELTLNLTIQ